MTRLVFDIETDGFLDAMTQIHCIVTEDLDTGEIVSYRPDEVEAGVQRLQDLTAADELVGQNIIGFDVPGIQKIFPGFKPKAKLTDTLIISRLVYANLRDVDFKRNAIPAKLRGRHGLEAWGHRLGFNKGDYSAEMKEKGLDPWAEFNEDMLEYCINDVQLNTKLYRMLLKHGFSDRSIRLEHDVRALCDQQEAFGCYFNEEAALELYGQLIKERESLEIELRNIFGSWWVGTEFTPKRNNKTSGYVQGAPLSKIERIEFNPGSGLHIAKRLGDLRGWKPKKFTPSGQPCVDEAIMKKLPYPEAKPLCRYQLLAKRIGQIAEGKEAWLKLLKGDRIYGRIATNAAITSRATHSKPNLGQVPTTKSPFGPECRSLFGATPGWSFVGADASGLELRCLAHYLSRYDNGAYTDIVLNGDIHNANMRAAGLTDRDQAKTFIYALLYGAGDFKIGTIVKKGAAAGRALRARFMKAIPAYDKLSRGIKKAAKNRGKIKALDGRFLYVRSEHSALNTLLQGAGAIIMKQAMVNYHAILAGQGLHHGDDYRQVLWVHDEFQVECRPELVKIVGEAMVEGIRMCTAQFDFGCPLDAEYKTGPTWAETH